MSTRAKLWLAPAIFYAIFVFWYTDFGGPLSDEEVDTWVEQMEANQSAPELIAYFEKFLRNDSGHQFLMVNVIDMNENPPHVEGAEPGESADQLMARYMEHMIPALLKRASHPALMGNAVYSVIDMVGIEGAENWDSGALFRYRSRRSFAEIISHPAIAAKHEFKTAALSKTIAYPIETRFYLGDPRLVLGLLILAITALLDTFVFSRKRTQEAAQ
ncbi:MAG: hypothetical protein HKO71_06580 [Pseudomonadales bacterium]|nr:hypothetical protein [Pseudomonadales bacterium]